MLTEVFELDLANSGLGGLDEVSALRLFATTQAHALVAGTGRTLRDIDNVDGVPLYPAFYRTRVSVPPPITFAGFSVWERVEIGVEIRRFGRMLLESIGVLGKPGSLKQGSGPEAAGLIRIEGSLAFVHDLRHGRDLSVDAPRAGATTELAAMRELPEAPEAQRRIRCEGIMPMRGEGPSTLSGRMRQPILLGRDTQAGRAMMFAGFTSLLEVAEQTLLLEQIWPPMGPELLSHRELLEREVHYVSNVRQGDSVVMDTVGTLSPCPADIVRAYNNRTGAAILELRTEIYEERTHALVAAAQTRKVFAPPRTCGADLQDIQRLLRRHGETR
jgi:probable biosynthetic protein (TIGR04098 family)